MPNLTKKFTRDSLKRANRTTSSEDLSKQQIIQAEMARARAKSLQSRNALTRTSNRFNAAAQMHASPYRSLLADDTAHVSKNSTTNHYNAEIISTMSSLTEPTWAPSMSMDIANSGLGSGIGGPSNHQQSHFQNHQETVMEEEEPAVMTVNSHHSDNRSLNSGYPHLHPQQPLSPKTTVSAPTTTEQRDQPPDTEATTRRKKERDPNKKRHSRKERSSSVSSRRSTYSVPVDPRQFESSSSKREKRSSRRRHRSKSRNPESRSKRSSSVPPITQQDETRMSSRGTLAQTYDVAAASTHDEQIAAAMAKFRMYQDSKKTGNDTQSIVATPTDEKSRKTKSSAEEASESLHRNAILSISSTQDNMSATGSVARSTSKPRSTVEAARMSLRPTIRRTSSNRSVSSMNSESFSMASSARMTSSKSGEGTPRPEEVAEAAPSHRRSSGVVSRIQKLNQDARTRAIHQSKSKFHQSLKSRPSEGIEQDEIPTIPSNSMTLPKVTSMECSVQEPFQEQASKLATTNKDGTANVSVIKGLFFIAKYILWNLPQDVAAILYGLVRFFTGRSHWTAHRKTVLLTGASTKIAAETARQLAMEGARLALVAPSPLEDLEHLAEECRELGSSKVHVYSADLTNVMSAEMTIQQAAKDFGGKFNVVMVHGQSLGQGCHFEEIQEPSEMEHMMKENVLSCMVTLHYALKYIPKTRDSRIVVTSSTLAVVASPFQTVYAASQHALSGFCNSLRMELKTTYSRKAPRVCLVIPETAGHAHDRMLSMGAVLPPTKAYSWAGTPLQHAVHDLLEAVGRGCREFGTPPYVKRWKCLSVLAPSLVDWSIVRHVQNTHYRPLEETLNGNAAAAAAANVTPNMKKKEVGAQSLRRVSGGHGNASWMRQRHNAGVQAVGNKTWS